jgi:hypothetical protein
VIEEGAMNDEDFGTFEEIIGGFVEVSPDSALGRRIEHEVVAGRSELTVRMRCPSPVCRGEVRDFKRTFGLASPHPLASSVRTDTCPVCGLTMENLG